MKVHLSGVTVPLEQSATVAEFKKLAAQDRVGGCAVTEFPDAADLILFVDMHMCRDWRGRPLLAHPLLARFPERCMVYDERDYPWNILPGVYASMPASSFDAGTQRAWAYYNLSEKTEVRATGAPDILYSFVGSPGPRLSGGNAVRRAILSLRDDRAVLGDSSGFVFYDDHGDPAAHAARQRCFAETIGRSKFVLCPRGAGTSSFRMYEVMRAGRVPVIIADQWVAPIGPDWQKFSLRVKQGSVSQIPELLRQHETHWEEMAAAAAAAYREWFAPEVNFHNIIEQCRSIIEAGVRIDVKLQTERCHELRRHYAIIAARTHVGRMLRRVGLKR